MHQQTTMGAPSANDSDSLSNSMLSHGTWFTTTTNQMDAITTRQNKLKTQTNMQLTTIMKQLKNIQNSMEDQRKWQDSYNEYNGYDHDWPFTPDQLQMDEDNYNMNNTLAQQATSNSQMEDASTTKWEWHLMLEVKMAMTPQAPITDKASGQGQQTRTTTTNQSMLQSNQTKIG